MALLPHSHVRNTRCGSTRAEPSGGAMVRANGRGRLELVGGGVEGGGRGWQGPGVAAREGRGWSGRRQVGWGSTLGRVAVPGAVDMHAGCCGVARGRTRHERRAGG